MLLILFKRIIYVLISGPTRKKTDLWDALSLFQLQTYNIFSKKVSDLKIRLQNKIEYLKKNSFIIFGYGASAKGNVLLNYCKIDNEYLEFITDTTILKQGKFTPGTHIPIISPKILKKKSKGYVALLLAWNYKNDIISREKRFLKNGGKFLIPIPNPILI